MWAYNNTDELYHHGIRGQKWGVRRYQNKYGALTPAGKRRQAKLESDYDSLNKIGALSVKGKKKKAEIENEYKSLTGKSVKSKKQESEITENKPEKKASDSKTKSTRDMSDAELKSAVDRMNNEKRYKDLYAELNPVYVSTGRKFINGLKDVGTSAASEAGKQILKDMLVNQSKKILGSNANNASKTAEAASGSAKEAAKKMETAAKEAAKEASDKQKKEAAAGRSYIKTYLALPGPANTTHHKK